MKRLGISSLSQVSIEGPDYSGCCHHPQDNCCSILNSVLSSTLEFEITKELLDVLKTAQILLSVLFSLLGWLKTLIPACLPVSPMRFEMACQRKTTVKRIIYDPLMPACSEEILTYGLCKCSITTWQYQLLAHLAKLPYFLQNTVDDVNICQVPIVL